MWALTAAVAAELGDLAGTALGVGPIMAGVSAALQLSRRRCEGCLFVGTAGTYASGPPVGSVIVSRRLGYASATAVIGAGYVPVPPPVLDTPEWLRNLAGVTQADVVTVDAITSSSAAAELLGHTWQVEHMEAWAVARAASEVGIPFAAILGIANEVGPHAHAQWLANRAAAEASAREVVATLLKRLRGGSPSTH